MKKLNSKLKKLLFFNKFNIISLLITCKSFIHFIKI